MMSEFDTETGEIIESARVDMPPTQLGVQPRMQPLASADVTDVCTALAKAQGQIEAPKRTKEVKAGSYSYSYAPLEEVIRVIQKPLAEHGLSRQQYLVSRTGQWFVRTIIWHVSGQWISSDYPIFVEQMTQQKFQSGVTYAKRQGLCLALGLAPEDDDDANVADARPATIADKQSPGQPPGNGSRHKPVTPAIRQQTGDQRARGAVLRIRDEIDQARDLEELNRSGVHGPKSQADEQLIKAQVSGARVWEDLLDRDAKKRLDLAQEKPETMLSPEETEDVFAR